MNINRIKKILAVTLATALIVTTFAGCKGKNDPKIIKVGVCAGPYGDMFKEAIQPSLEKLGYKIKIIEFSDYVQPNNALAEKDIDVNMFQHSTYLKKFSTEQKLDLSYITEIPTAAMGVFSSKYNSIEKLPKGAKIAIPNDDTNLSRALRVLVQTGVIKLNKNVNPAAAKVKDIAENPKGLKFTEVSAEILPTVLDSVDAAVINGNYAIGAGLKLSDAVYNEKLAEGYYNVIAVRTADKDSALSKDIVAIVHSDKFRKIIEDPKKQYSAFGRPSGYSDNK